MSIEVKTTDMLMYPREGAKFLDGPFCCLKHLALQTLGLSWNVLNPGGLQSFVDRPRLI